MKASEFRKLIREEIGALREGKGYDAAHKLISSLRSKVYPKLNDDELWEFKQIIADHIDAKIK